MDGQNELIEDYIGISNLTEVIHEMSLTSDDHSSAITEPIQNLKIFLSGALLSMHF